MLNLNKAAVLILSAVLASAASAAGMTGTSADYGRAVADASYDRVVTIKPGMKYANITDGETVKFEIDGKSFTWSVHTYPNQNSFQLSRIAPADIDASGVTVYVAPNPLYIGG
ncbi:CzcE family metal-binding protein [Massilia niastensis]|uniref:CzcE family metal-binding protein n=1 Tax=Massilia niastensis TaxID=544911 RepID=UPI00035F9F2E|nr:CzcE family metal-binding protein [Massilia niastensis]